MKMRAVGLNMYSTREKRFKRELHLIKVQIACQHFLAQYIVLNAIFKSK
jgi:hypothetical protein